MNLSGQRTSLTVALLALFVALGGTSYAVTKLPKNSVRSQQVVDGSLQAKDLAPGALSGGPRGPRGVAGPAGPPGPSQGYVSRALRIVPVASSAGRTLITRLRIPAGSYALDFSTNAYATGTAVFLDCALEASDALLAASTARLGGEAGAAVQQQLGMSDAVTFGGAVTVNVFCSQRGIDAGVQVVEARLRAIRLGSVDVQ